MAEQTLIYRNNGFDRTSFSGVSGIGWSGNRRINADLVGSSAQRWFRYLFFFSDGKVRLNIGLFTTNDGDARDLSSAFETGGSISVSSFGAELRVDMGGLDLSEPYVFTPSNSEEVIAFYKHFDGQNDGSQAATITIRDFVPVLPYFDDDTGDEITGTIDAQISSITVPKARSTPASLYSVHNSSLPDGLNFNESTRIISGTPSSGGTGTIIIRANNGEGTADWTVDYDFIVPSADDYAWILYDRDSPPDTPTGGNDTEEHDPSGWSRTEFTPTESLALWRSHRTRTYSGMFSSASDWGDPERTMDKLLSLSDVSIPLHRLLISGVDGSLIEAGTSNVIIYDSSTSIISGNDPPNLGDGTLQVSSIRITGTDDLRINNSGVGDIEALYESGGIYGGRHIHIQTDIDGDEIASFMASKVDASRSTSDRLWYDATIAQFGILKGVSKGDRWLFFVTERDPSAPAEEVETTIRYSDIGLVTEPGDSPPNLNILSRMSKGFEFSSEISNPSIPRAVSNNSFGSISLINEDGELDDIVGRVWEGTNLTLKIGGKYNVGWKEETKIPFWDYFEIIKTVVTSVDWNQSSINLSLANRGINEMSRNIQSVLFEGDGGLEGGDNIGGKPRPLCFGHVINLSPVLVDELNLIYQIHDGSIEEVLDVRDSGITLLFNKNVEDIEAEDSSLQNGYYNKSLSTGYIKLSSPPEGTVTADVKGYNSEGYIYTAGDIISTIASQYTDLDDNTEIDHDSISGADQDRNMGFYTKNESIKVSNVFDFLVKGINAFWCFNRLGQLCMGRYLTPEDEPPVRNIKERDILDKNIEREPTPPPVWRCTVRYARSWEVQEGNKIAASLRESDEPDDVRRSSLYGEEYRQVVAQDDFVLQNYPNAREIIIDTALIEESDAQQEANDRFDRDKRVRDIHRVSLVDTILVYELGEVISLSFSRYGLNNGRNFIVLGYREDSSEKITEVTLYG